MMSASETETRSGLSSPEPMDLSADQHFRPFPPHHATLVPFGHVPHRGSVIPNRIFVGGIDSSIAEDDLWQYFSEYGRVTDVKILTDSSGFPKGYGFISFETREEVQKILQNADRVQFKDKFFFVGPAVRKQQGRGRTRGFSERRGSEDHTRGFSERRGPEDRTHLTDRSHHPSSASTPMPVLPLPVPYGPVYLTTPDGLPYTYHNGVAYFQRPEDIQSAHHWPSSSGTHHAYPPVMLSPPPQPAPLQPAYQHYQYMQEYLQRSVYLYQDVEQHRASGGWVQPALPAISEEQTLQVVYQGFRPLPRIKHRHGRRFNRSHSARLEYIPEVSEPEETPKPLGESTGRTPKPPVTHAAE